MSGKETDSLWLQKSFTLPDPLPDVTGTTPESKAMPSTAEVPPPKADKATPPLSDKELHKPSDGADAPESQTASAPTPQAAKDADVAIPSAQQSQQETPNASIMHETDLTRMLLDTSGLVRGGGPSSARQSASRYSMARASLSSAAFISTQEYDDLRAKYSQAKRELLKVSDIQKDLDYLRFELTRTQEELKLTTQDKQKLSAELEVAEERVEKALKAKRLAESQVEEREASLRKEVAFLKDQIEALRLENTKRVEDFAHQQEQENTARVQALREELEALSSDNQAMCQRIEEMEQERERVVAERDTALSHLRDATGLSEAHEKRLAALKEELREATRDHETYVDAVTRDREEALRNQQQLADQRVDQLTRAKDAYIKDLKDELEDARDKLRSITEECALLRHGQQQLTTEAEQRQQAHAKEIRRLKEEHELALSEKELQFASNLKESEGTRAAVKEEVQALRRQLSSVTEELSTVAAVLSQREKQNADAERELASLRERVYALEQDNVQLANDAELNAAAAEDASERVRRLNEQKDTLENEYAEDLRSAKERVRSLESSLMDANRQLSDLRRQHTSASADERSAVKELRAELQSVTEDRDNIARKLREERDRAAAAEAQHSQYLQEKHRSEHLEMELSAAMRRLATLEKKLEDAQLHNIAGAMGIPPKSTASRSASQTAMGGPRLRSGSAANRCWAPNSLGRSGSSVKRARTEDARVFAISGFDGNDMLSAIKQLPNVAIAECRSNTPVPTNLTHLVTNGQLTIKLLTALVRGCWVLPGDYVTESLKRHNWLPESDYGFQHAEPPLLHRRITVTDPFTATKHYSTASLLLQEGGAIVDDDAPAEKSDYVLCTSAELEEYPDNGITWEKMVELIYPVRIQ